MNDCKVCRHFEKLVDDPVMGNCRLKREMVGEGYECKIILEDEYKPTNQQLKVLRFIDFIMSQTSEYSFVKFEGNSRSDANVFIAQWHSKADAIYKNYIMPKNYQNKQNKYRQYNLGEEQF